MRGVTGKGPTSTGARRDCSLREIGRDVGGSAGWRSSEPGRRAGARVTARECRAPDRRDVREADDASCRDARWDSGDERQAREPRRGAGVEPGVQMIVRMLRRRDRGDDVVRIDDHVVRIVFMLAMMRRAVRQRFAGHGKGGQREQGGDGQS